MLHKKTILSFILALLYSQLFYGTNVLVVQNSESSPKSSVTIFIGANNDTPFNALQFDLLFPSELKWVNDGVRVTSRANGHAVSASLIVSGRLRIIAWSALNSDFTGTTGNVVELDFISGEDPGTYPVTIENATLSGTDGNILSGVTNGTFILKAPQINLSSATVGWGRIPLLQEAFRTLTITNNGNLPLIVSELNFIDNRFSNTLTLPFTLGAGESQNIDIRFYSTVKGIIAGKLTIVSNDPYGQNMCNLSVVAFAVNEIHIGNAAGRSGYEMTIPVSINNMEPFNAFQIKIKLPAVAKFIKGSEVLFSARKDDHVIIADTSRDILTLVAYSPANKPFLLNDGVVLNFKLLVEGQGGRYSLSQSEPVISDSDGKNSLSASYDGWLDIASPVLAVNSNEINFGDVSTLESAIKELILFNNGNDDLIINQISIGDNAFTHNKPLPFTILPGENKAITLSFNANDGLTHETILRIRSNDLPRDPANILLKAKSFFPNELRVPDQTVNSGTNTTLFVELFNQLPASGLQCDIEFPIGINPLTSSVFLTGRKVDHVIVTSDISSGKIRILSYSGSLKSFSGNSGNIIGIPVQVSGSLYGTFPVAISNVVISDNSGKSIGTGSKSGIITVDITTGTNKTDLLAGINVYPNPFNDKLNIIFNNSISNKVTLYGLDGKVIWTQEVLNSHLIINSELLSPGLYVLKVIGGKNTEIKKVVRK